MKKLLKYLKFIIEFRKGDWALHENENSIYHKNIYSLTIFRIFSFRFISPFKKHKYDINGERLLEIATYRDDSKYELGILDEQFQEITDEKFELYDKIFVNSIIRITISPKENMKGKYKYAIYSDYLVDPKEVKDLLNDFYLEKNELEKNEKNNG